MKDLGSNLIYYSEEEYLSAPPKEVSNLPWFNYEKNTRFRPLVSNNYSKSVGVYAITLDYFNEYSNKTLPSSSIERTLAESKVLLNYTNGWLGEDSIGTNFEAYSHATEFIRQYNQLILRTYGSNLPPPFINTMFDGSVYVEWDTERAYLNIIFKENSEKAYFYSKTKVDGIETKSWVNIGQVNLTLLFWMSSNLC